MCRHRPELTAGPQLLDLTRTQQELPIEDGCRAAALHVLKSMALQCARATGACPEEPTSPGKPHLDRHWLAAELGALLSANRKLFVLSSVANDMQHWREAEAVFALMAR